ncbi:thioredoxin family protein [uncultured Massilia sp.]|uniref:thioredoxin family protein n=1 Tax=uncultured Massilia sp. TaxID=169973 RepID=UPI0025D27F86|nr:thioredoxin family protein [uncultured Massilia sp.]
MTRPYDTIQPDRTAIDARSGVTAIDFGTNWCGYCKAAESHIERALAQYPEIVHVKVEDGPGRALGRSFRVKLWPTVVIMKDGREVARVVRPEDDQEVVDALSQADGE